jgi:hypothetical protein
MVRRHILDQYDIAFRPSFVRRPKKLKNQMYFQKKKTKKPNHFSKKKDFDSINECQRRIVEKKKP